MSRAPHFHYLTAPPLAVPQELRVTIQAFHRMQNRLRRFLEGRTQMLAAISHDFRAPPEYSLPIFCWRELEAAPGRARFIYII